MHLAEFTMIPPEKVKNKKYINKIKTSDPMVMVEERWWGGPM